MSFCVCGRAGPFGEVRPGPPVLVAGSWLVLFMTVVLPSSGSSCHMTRSRTLLALLVVALLAVVASPAEARTRDPRAAREAARARKARAASRLNAIRASESQLVRAARALDDQVATEQAHVEAARRSLAVADAQLAAATNALAQTKASLQRLNHQVVERAISDYMSPRQVEARPVDVIDLAAEARKTALLDAVSASNADLLDALRAAKEDHALQQQAAQTARERARARKAQIDARLAALKGTRAAQARTAAALLARKRAVLGEIAAQSRSEAYLTSLILQRSRPSTGGTSVRSARGCIWPTRGRVSSEYGRRWGRLHAGIDISASRGTSIWAARSGIVIFAGRQSGYGNVVIIDHGGGFTTLYGHQSRLAVRDGQSVGQGRTIGYVGSTGRSTGNHLHFETRYSGRPRNPRGCLS
jgi:murein DD-endopeptidase MepM/ murein hydrolase activator NlpD